MKKPRTRLEVYASKPREPRWSISLYIKGICVARCLKNRAGWERWMRKADVKAWANRWAAELGNIPVVVAK